MFFSLKPSSPALRPFIRSLWYHAAELAHERERVLPNGKMQILINLAENELRSYRSLDDPAAIRHAGAVIAGPSCGHTFIDTREQRRIVGVDFFVGGAAPLLCFGAHELRDGHVHLPDAFGRSARTWRERLLECPSPGAVLAMLERLLLDSLVAASERRVVDDERLVRWALPEMDRGVGVGALRTESGLSPKRFIQCFRDVVGLRPKQISRILRFQRTVQRAISSPKRVPWAQLAVAAGYADQAHMVREFRELSGLTPAAYRPRAAFDPLGTVEANHSLA